MKEKEEKELKNKLKELEKQNLELKFKFIELEKQRIVNEIKNKYPEMLEKP